MRLARFERLLAAYGPDLNLWPEGHMKAAQELMLLSPRAAACLKAERDLEAVLQRGLHFPDSRGTSTDRVIARALGRIDDLKCQSAVSGYRLPFWVQNTGLACAGLLLFLLGIGYGSLQSAAGTNEDTAATLILNGPYHTLVSL